MFNVLINQSGIEMERLAAWKMGAVKEITSILAEENFPCVFARRSNSLQGINFLFVDTVNPYSFDSEYNKDILISGLQEYTNFCHAALAKDRLFSPLIIIFNFIISPLALSHKKAWEILQYILEVNEFLYVQGTESSDPNQLGWEFEFNDVPLFFNINHGHHQKHKSRNLGGRMVMVVNPTENFEIVAPVVNGERKISNMIRERVKNYNHSVIAETLGIFDSDKPDWKQYQHAEGDAQLPAVCPLKTARGA